MCLSASVEALDSLQVSNEAHFVQFLIPNMICWPEGMSALFYSAVSDRYFERVTINHSLLRALIQQAQSPGLAVEALRMEGMFATHVGREALLDITSSLPTTEITETVERYARYAFVLDGLDVTCGTLPQT